MKKRNLVKKILMSGALILTLASCQDKCAKTTCPEGYICDQGKCILDPDKKKDDVQVVSGRIQTATTWTADRIWELDGKVVVEQGATLTIEPGTIIKGRTGTGALASALVIARGAKIEAVGTVEHPIIFTSVLDNIKLGEKTGTNLDEKDRQKWGGVILLGKAKVSAKIGDTEGQIEGIPADEDYGRYGGEDDKDNSGTLAYISIRHGGALIGEGNEINGLTLGGVGSGTTIHHIEIVANLDDGIECFGGTVTVEHALVAYQGDDAFDIDQNFAGTFVNSAAIYDNTGDEFLEIDGPENSTYAEGKFTVENCTFISKTGDGSVDLKSKAQGVITNCKFEGLTRFQLSAKFEEDCTTLKHDAYNNYIDSNLKVTGNKTDAQIYIYTKSQDNNGNTCSITDEMKGAVQSIFDKAGNGKDIQVEGADLSAFEGWTWSSINGKI